VKNRLQLGHTDHSNIGLIDDPITRSNALVASFHDRILDAKTPFFFMLAHQIPTLKLFLRPSQIYTSSSFLFYLVVFNSFCKALVGLPFGSVHGALRLIIFGGFFFLDT
jgi:hypothetical protein